MSGDLLALGTVAALAAAAVASRRGSRAWPDWTASDAAAQGRAWDRANDPGDVAASDLDWRYEPAYPVDDLVHLMSGGDWSRWLQEQTEWREQELGHTDWLRRFSSWWLATPTDEPVVLVEDADGKSEGIWDGWHRTAVSIHNRRPTLPAFVGRRRRGSASEPSERAARIAVARSEPQKLLCNVHQVIPASYLARIPQYGQSVVTIYRSVPTGVDEIRPGDWVALSRRYAAQHGRGKVLSLRVPADQVMWAGTDLDEWFYVPESGSANKPTFVVRSEKAGLALLKHADIVANYNRSLKVKRKHKTAVLVPCAGTKPFPQAPSHKHGYLVALEGKKADVYVVSEPLGVVPYAWSRTYPNDAYDYPPKYLRGKAYDLLRDRIRTWFEKVGRRYSRIVLALPEHHAKLVRAATRGLSLPLEDASISACRSKGSCPDTAFRATSEAYRGWLGRKVSGSKSYDVFQWMAIDMAQKVADGDLYEVRQYLHELSAYLVGQEIEGHKISSWRGRSDEPTITLDAVNLRVHATPWRDDELTQQGVTLSQPIQRAAFGRPPGWIFVRQISILNRRLDGLHYYWIGDLDTDAERYKDLLRPIIAHLERGGDPRDMGFA